MHIIFILAFMRYAMLYFVLWWPAMEQCRSVGRPVAHSGSRKEKGNFSPFAIPHVHASAPTGTPLVILYEVTPMQTCTCYSNSPRKKMIVTPMGPLNVYNNTRDQWVQLARALWTPEP